MNSHFFPIAHWGPFILSLVPSTKLYGMFVTDSQMSLSFSSRTDTFFFWNAIDRFNYMQLKKIIIALAKQNILSLMCLAAKTFIWPRLHSLKSPSVNYNVIWDEVESHLWCPGLTHAVILPSICRCDIGFCLDRHLVSMLSLALFQHSQPWLKMTKGKASAFSRRTMSDNYPWVAWCLITLSLNMPNLLVSTASWKNRREIRY